MANQHNFPLLGQAFLGTKILSASVSLVGTDSGKGFSNAQATANITVSLPQAKPGYQFQFLVVAAHNIIVQPVSTDTIRGSSTGTATTLTTVGSLLYIECINAGFWEVVAESPPGGGPSGLPAPPNTSIQFNNSGVFGGSANLTWNGQTLEAIASGANVAIQAINTTTGSGSQGILGLSNLADADFNVFLTQVGAASKHIDIGTSTPNPLNILTGGAIRLTVDGGGSYFTQSLNSAGFSAAYQGVAGVLINNASSTMQSTLDFGKAGVLSGRVRNDFQGGLSLVSTSVTAGNGVTLWVGGDSGVGTPRLDASGPATAPLVQIIGGGSGSTSSFATGVRATLQLNGSSDSIIDFAVNSTSNAYIYNVPNELRLNSLVGNITFYAAGTQQATLSQTTGLIINAPTTNTYALSATATSTTIFSGGAALFSAPNTTGQSNGVRIVAGTNTSDMQLILTNAANTINRWSFDGSGALFASGLTSEGAGTINAAGLFINNVAVLAPITGSFTVTGTGFAAGPTGTATYSIIGSEVILTLPALSGTSNATTFTLTGLPVAIQAAHAQEGLMMATNSSAAVIASFTLNASSGTLTLANYVSGTFTTWTATGTKGIGVATTIQYSIA